MNGEESPRIIRSKLRPPEPSAQLVARPRIERRLRDLLERHAVVVVSATAGSGKTTAVTRGARRPPPPPRRAPPPAPPPPPPPPLGEHRAVDHLAARWSGGGRRGRRRGAFPLGC